MRNSVNFYLQKLIRLNIKIFICALILALNFNSFSKADDISEFEIEGLSIGYSLLNKYSKKEIEDLYKEQLHYLQRQAIHHPQKATQPDHQSL